MRRSTGIIAANRPVWATWRQIRTARSPDANDRRISDSQFRIASKTNCANCCAFPASAPIASTKPTCAKAGEWVLKQFQSLGLEAELIETAGHPLVYAESPPVPGKPTVLVYGHYDVQPPDPLDEWISPPFEPTRRDGNIYARGATDDKGQMLTHVKSAEAWLKTARQAAGAVEVSDRRGRGSRQREFVRRSSPPTTKS